MQTVLVKAEGGIGIVRYMYFNDPRGCEAIFVKCSDQIGDHQQENLNKSLLAVLNHVGKKKHYSVKLFQKCISIFF